MKIFPKKPKDVKKTRTVEEKIADGQTMSEELNNWDTVNILLR